MKLSRKVRLSTKADFSRVFASPTVSRDACFSVLRRANGMGYSRLGMAVSKKNCRKATGRNRIKRVIRESFRINQLELAGQGGEDFVVLPSSQATTICNSSLKDSLMGHWQKASNPDSSRQDKSK